MHLKGWDQGDLARAAGLSRETVRPFTNGQPAERAEASMAKVAIALGEPGDAIIRILEGDDPERLTTHPAGNVADRLNSLEEESQRQGELLTKIAAHLGLDGP